MNFNNQQLESLGLLPSFTDMDTDATAEEIMRVAALAETILNLTFKNPFPIGQDPVFKAVLKANNEWAKEQLQNGKYQIEAHEELKDAYEKEYSASTVKTMMEIDYWNQRMIEHAVLTRTLGPKPAFQCLQAALNLFPVAGEGSAILIVNYAHLLLKSTTLPLQNTELIGDITQVLRQASAFLHFEEGMKYEPKQGKANRMDGPNEEKDEKTVAKGSNGKLMRPKFTKEETLALGNMALSFIVVNGKPDAKAEPVVIHELEGFTLEDVKQMYTNLKRDMTRLYMILYESCMTDPFKKMYATGFLSKAILSRTDKGKAPLVEIGWRKMVRSIFGFAGEGTQSIEAGAKLYDEFEHPKIDPDTLFLIFSWLSQVNYK